ncbi:hypothetical protein GW846_03170 [Candidatus Gracilibacteria bacterium]|nr:hypothetical protein [Candidatus Gracilibacteria bacterium]
MAKNIKGILYSIMTSDEGIMSLVENSDQVYYQNDDADVNRAQSKFDSSIPLITYHRITDNAAEYPKRRSLFQITSWAKTNLQAEELMNAIVTCFNRRQNMDGISYVSLNSVDRDTYDKEIKCWGIHLTFTFIYRDLDF